MKVDALKDYQKATIEKQENHLHNNQIRPSPPVVVHETNKKAPTDIENFLPPKLQEDGNVEKEDGWETASTDEPSDLEQESNDEENHDKSANELPTNEIENNEGLQILQADAGSDTEHSEAEEEQVDATFVTQPKQHEIPQVIQPENPTTTFQNSNEVVEQNIPFYRDTKEIILKCALQSTPAANQTVPATPTPNFHRQNSNMVNQFQFTESGSAENRSKNLNFSGGTYINCVIGGDTITVLPQNTNQQQE
ncbi:uncharacterized protein LOC144745432 [Ciona intestinalis]